MQTLTYHWINVFTTEQDSGNPLPVFILEEALSAPSMQKIAAMFNQSETLFIENAQSQTPILHIYTPMHPLPFAGHPIIGALEILNRVRENRPLTAVKCDAGIVPVETTTNNTEGEMTFPETRYWIKAPKQPTARKSDLTLALSASMLGLTPAQIMNPPQWMNTGSEQLIVELRDKESIDNISIDIALFEQYATLYEGRTMIYLWAHDPHSEKNDIYSRFLYLKNGHLDEDSGTGSACANLGGYQSLQGKHDFTWRLQQGNLIQKESILYLKVAEDHSIWIGGKNRYMGHGQLYWED